MNALGGHLPYATSRLPW